jgi:hypothetical protein
MDTRKIKPKSNPTSDTNRSDQLQQTITKSKLLPPSKTLTATAKKKH